MAFEPHPCMPFEPDPCTLFERRRTLGMFGAVFSSLGYGEMYIDESSDMEDLDDPFGPDLQVRVRVRVRLMSIPPC